MISGTNPREVTEFNTLAIEYNAHCGRFFTALYRDGALAPIEAEARRRDAELRGQAFQHLLEWRRASAPGATPQSYLGQAAPALPSTNVTAPAPWSPRPLAPQRPQLLDLRDPDDARIVQRRLQELGYYRAPIDGAFGPRSIAALAAFKQDHPRLPADEEWDLEAQRALFDQ